MPEDIFLPKGLTFGAQLRLVRRAKGITTTKLAELANIHKSTITDIEYDRYRSTKIETVQLLSKALDFYNWDLFK